MNWIKNNYAIVEKNSNQRKKQKQFGLLFAVIVAVILVISFYKNGFVMDVKQNILIGVLTFLSLTTLVFPKLFYPFLCIWLSIGFVFGEISSFIILVFLYYCLISPITYFLRLKNKEKQIPTWIDKSDKINYQKLS